MCVSDFKELGGIFPQELFLDFLFLVADRDQLLKPAHIYSLEVRFYTMVKPPLTLRVCPVTKSALGEAKKSTASAISSGFATRRNGVALVTASISFSV